MSGPDPELRAAQARAGIAERIRSLPPERRAEAARRAHLATLDGAGTPPPGSARDEAHRALVHAALDDMEREPPAARAAAGARPVPVATSSPRTPAAAAGRSPLQVLAARAAATPTRQPQPSRRSGAHATFADIEARVRTAGLWSHPGTREQVLELAWAAGGAELFADRERLALYFDRIAGQPVPRPKGAASLQPDPAATERQRLEAVWPRERRLQAVLPEDRWRFMCRQPERARAFLERVRAGEVQAS